MRYFDANYNAYMTGDVTTVGIIIYLYQVLPKPSSPRQWILFNADLREEVSLLRKH